jgi:hypothetical protein
VCEVFSQVERIDGVDHFAQHPGWLSAELDLAAAFIAEGPGDLSSPDWRLRCACVASR